MTHDPTILWIKLVALFCVILLFIIIIQETGFGLTLLGKAMCRMGKHKMDIKIGRSKIRKYYCEHCKVARKHPELKSIDGGSSHTGGKFRF